MPKIDFTLIPLVREALGVAFALPPILWLLSRVPALREKNAIQFLCAYLATTALFATVWIATDDVTGMDCVVGLLIVHCAVIAYLEVWALLSRGYTLGLLLVLYRSHGAVPEETLARLYRGGEGISWIMRHRLSGLKAASMVKVQGDMVALTACPGRPVALAYKAAYLALGLRKSG